MPAATVYARKAEKYARYRWGYAPQAVEAIYDRTGAGCETIIIELGAGTGILTRSVASKGGRVIAVEPDLEMNRWIREGLPLKSRVSVITAYAEEVPLPSHCADMILVAQAVHWFRAQPARQEIIRLLRNQCWLALLRNYGTDTALDEALRAVNTPDNGIKFHSRPSGDESKPAAYFFGHSDFCRLIFPFIYRQDWESFLGGISSASYAPEEPNPLFQRFKEHARCVFNQFSVDGYLETHGETEILLGQVRP